MTTTMWKQSPGSNSYSDASNWTSGLPGTNDTATFGVSNVTNISMVSDFSFPGGWVFEPGASQYNVEISGGNLSQFSVVGFGIGGITINGGSVHIYNFGEVSFDGNSSNISSASGAYITNFADVVFDNYCTAASSTIDTVGSLGPGSGTIFQGHSTGGSAQLITDAGGTVDFSKSLGLSGNHQLTVGSIAGEGIYDLGGDELTVGSNGLSTTVSGAVDDGGIGAGIGGSLVKVGRGTLTLSGAGNTYSGGTTLQGGTLDLAAIGAAGTGNITFQSGGKHNIETLKIENAALLGHHFTNKIDNFGKHDFLDLTGLHFHAGATAKYHPATDVLDVHSGHGTDKLTLVSPHGTHFEAASDHHGGTEVFLFFA